MEIFVIKTLQGLKPSFESDREQYDKLKMNEEYKAVITKPRNIINHRRFFALLNLCYANQERYDNFEDLRYVLILKAGFYTTIETDKGVIFRPKSINFASMDETEFLDLYSKMLDVVIKEIGVTSEQIEEQLINFM